LVVAPAAAKQLQLLRNKTSKGVTSLRSCFASSLPKRKTLALLANKKAKKAKGIIPTCEASEAIASLASKRSNINLKLSFLYIVAAACFATFVVVASLPSRSDYFVTKQLLASLEAVTASQVRVASPPYGTKQATNKPPYFVTASLVIASQLLLRKLGVTSLLRYQKELLRCFW
jgi:hypothetical protein